MLAVTVRRVKWRVRTHLRQGHSAVDAEELRRLSVHVQSYLDSLGRVNGFGFFERLFSLWHALHMPIFFMLLVTGIVHVWAVHNY